MIAIAIDDEPKALDIVRVFAEKVPFLELKATFQDAFEALDYLQKEAVDLIFLDIKMPDISGLEFLKVLSTPPLVIFTTAYAEHAVQSYDFDAIDYLLKPFSEERLEATLKRAKEQLKSENNLTTDERLLSLLAELKNETNYLSRLTIKDRGKIMFVSVDEIESIVAQGNYLEINSESSHLIRMRLHQLEAKLDPEKFIRIHRSTIVNIDCIRELHPLFNGDQHIIMQSGKKLTMTRNYRDKLKSLLGNF